jgi:hypothetical protein
MRLIKKYDSGGYGDLIIVQFIEIKTYHFSDAYAYIIQRICKHDSNMGSRRGTTVLSLLHPPLAEMYILT